MRTIIRIAVASSLATVLATSPILASDGSDAKGFDWFGTFTRTEFERPKTERLDAGEFEFEIPKGWSTRKTSEPNVTKFVVAPTAEGAKAEASTDEPLIKVEITKGDGSKTASEVLAGETRKLAERGIEPRNELFFVSDGTTFRGLSYEFDNLAFDGERTRAESEILIADLGDGNVLTVETTSPDSFKTFADYGWDEEYLTAKFVGTFERKTKPEAEPFEILKATSPNGETYSVRSDGSVSKTNPDGTTDSFELTGTELPEIQLLLNFERYMYERDESTARNFPNVWTGTWKDDDGNELARLAWVARDDSPTREMTEILERNWKR